MLPEAATTPDVLAAEQALTGAAISGRDHADLAATLVDPASLTRPENQFALAAACDLAAEGNLVDPTAVLHRLTQRGQLGATGGGPYLATLTERAAIGGEGSLRFNAEIINSAAQRQRYRMAGQQIVQLSDDAGWDPATHPEMAEQFLTAAASVSTETADLPMFGEHTPAFIDRLQNGTSPALPTGWADVDRIVRMKRGQLVTIGARPSVGKTIAAVNMSVHLARQGHPVLLSSLEMDADSIHARVFSAQARITLDRLTGDGGHLTEDDWQRLADAQSDTADMPLYVDDTQGVGVAHIRSRLRWMHRRGIYPAMVAVDYLDRLRLPDAARHDIALGKVTSELKDLASEFNLVVVLLCQLNREVEHRADHRPRLADLKNTSSIEQDADVVMLLHREDDEAQRGCEVEVLVEKNRNGPVGVVSLANRAHFASLSSMAPED